MPNRHASTSEYRYGFNDKEKDDEVMGEDVQYDYGFRIYDSRIGRFLSTDPLAKNFPWYTPYQFAGNKPIAFIDLDGLEEANVHILGRYEDGTVKVRVLKTESPNNSNDYKLNFNYIGISDSSNLTSNLNTIIPGILRQGNSILNNSKSPQSAGSYDWAFKVSYKAIDETNTKLISSGNQTLISDSSYSSELTDDPKEVRGGNSQAGGFTSTDVTLRTKLEFTINSSANGGSGYVENKGDQYINEFAAPFVKEFNSEMNKKGLDSKVVTNVKVGLSDWLYQNDEAVKKVENYFKIIYPKATIELKGGGPTISVETKPINLTEINQNIPILNDNE